MTDARHSRALAALAAALAPAVAGGAANREGGEAGPMSPIRLLIGQVTAAHAGTPGSADITTDGVTSRDGVPCIVAVANGDVVFVLEQPPILLVLGPAAAW